MVTIFGCSHLRLSFLVPAARFLLPMPATGGLFMDHKQLRFFRKICEEKSINRAAQKTFHQPAGPEQIHCEAGERGRGPSIGAHARGGSADRCGPAAGTARRAVSGGARRYPAPAARHAGRAPPADRLLYGAAAGTAVPVFRPLHGRPPGGEVPLSQLHGYRTQPCLPERQLRSGDQHRPFGAGVCGAGLHEKPHRHHLFPAPISCTASPRPAFRT